MFSFTIRGKEYQAATLAGISAAYCKARDESGEGASRWPSAPVYQDRVHVGDLSYNGRVWSLAPWEPHNLPLYDPAADPVADMLAALKKCRVEMEMLRRQYVAEGKGEEWIERQSYLVGECDAAIAKAETALT